MGSANLVPVGYNGKKSSFIGDSEYLMWYNISFIWENTLCCSPQIVVSQYVSNHDDSSLKHFQPIHLLCCANVSFHEVRLLAETMNQCRSKIPQGKKPFYFQAKWVQWFWWQCSPTKNCVSSAVPGGGVRAHTQAAGTGRNTGNFLLFQSGYTKLAMLK